MIRGMILSVGEILPRWGLKLLFYDYTKCQQGLRSVNLPRWGLKLLFKVLLLAVG